MVSKKVYVVNAEITFNADSLDEVTKCLDLLRASLKKANPFMELTVKSCQEQGKIKKEVKPTKK